MFACRDFLTRWREAEARRRGECSALSDAGNGPPRYDQYLMNLLQFENVSDLQKFLSGPSHPGFPEQSEVPEEDYELLERERMEEEAYWLAKERMEEQAKRAEVRPILPTPVRSRITENALLWLTSISTLLIFFGFSKMPYGYYILLRAVVCLTAAHSLSLAVHEQKRLWVWTCGALVILYNPVFPVAFGSKGLWEVVNLLTLGLLWTVVWRVPEQDSSSRRGPLETILSINATVMFGLIWLLLQFRLVRRLTCDLGPSGEIPPAPPWHLPDDEKAEILAIAVTLIFAAFLAYIVVNVRHYNLPEPESQGVPIVNDGQ